MLNVPCCDSFIHPRLWRGIGRMREVWHHKPEMIPTITTQVAQIKVLQDAL